MADSERGQVCVCLAGRGAGQVCTGGPARGGPLAPPTARTDGPVHCPAALTCPPTCPASATKTKVGPLTNSWDGFVAWLSLSLTPVPRWVGVLLPAGYGTPDRQSVVCDASLSPKSPMQCCVLRSHLRVCWCCLTLSIVYKCYREPA